MRSGNQWLLWLAGLALLGAAGAAPAQEESVTLDKVPKAVLQSVKDRFKDAKPTAASKETENGKQVYEVTLKVEGKNVDVTLVPEGDIVMIETQIAVDDLPRKVVKRLEKKYPGAKYKFAEEIKTVENKEERLAYYEVLLMTADDQRVEVEINPDGKILKEEKGGEDE